MDLLARVRRFVARHDLIRPEARVVAAVSGGSDSIGLLSVLDALAAAGEVHLVGVAHFNHQLRDTAARDERVAGDAARRLGVPFLADRGDVLARARAEHRSLEDAARQCRYEFFERAREHFGADRVAVGHTRDDQAETFLLRLVRGAGPRGFAAMSPRRGTIIRPLLDVTRAEVRAYLDRRAIPFVDDETNADVGIPRNRVRLELVPLLAARFNPAIVDALANEATLAREMWAWAAAEADELERRAIRAAPNRVELDLGVLRPAPDALRRLVVWRAMTRMAAGRSVSFDQVDQALRLAAGEVGLGASADGPAQRVERAGDLLVLTGRTGRGAPPNLFEYSLSIPGEVTIVEAGCALSVEPVRSGQEPPGQAATGRGDAAVVRGDLCPGPLAVRNRRPGDRFRPVGVGGRKKLQDYFVDRKIARSSRDRVPLVVDDEGRIVWVAGLGIDEAFRVTDPSQTMLLLRLKPLGGPV